MASSPSKRAYHASLDRYDLLGVFASELVGALTEPSRADVVEAFDRLAHDERSGAFGERRYPSAALCPKLRACSEAG